MPILQGHWRSMYLSTPAVFASLVLIARSRLSNYCASTRSRSSTSSLPIGPRSGSTSRSRCPRYTKIALPAGLAPMAHRFADFRQGLPRPNRCHGDPFAVFDLIQR